VQIAVPAKWVTTSATVLHQKDLSEPEKSFWCPPVFNLLLAQAIE
jgi:hypothetical protein